MASIKGKVIRVVSHFALPRASVVSVQSMGGFQRIQFQSDAPKPEPGAKIQILLPSDDARTYTPIAIEGDMVLLAWSYAGGPGARWALDAKPGEIVPFVGPQRSLSLGKGPVVVVGDETSIAVAASYEQECAGRVQAVLQAQAGADVHAAAASVGLSNVVVCSPGDTSATVHAVQSALTSRPGAVVALTGGSKLIVAVRQALRGVGVTNIKSKAYWIPGKAGLD